MATGDKKRLALFGWAVALWAMSALCAVGGQIVVRNAADSPVAATPREAGSSTVIPVEPELLAFLDWAKVRAGQGRHGEAVEICQALIDRPNGGFLPGKQAGQYVPFRRKVNEQLSKMGPQVLAAYRKRYNVEAGCLYAAGRRDPATLRRITQQYTHTDYGLKALDELAAAHFDRGQFAQAAFYWRSAMQVSPGNTARALRLAKTAVALHLAGQAAPARTAADELEKRHPRATGVVAGRKQNLVAFVARARKLRSAAMSSPGGKRVAGWGGLGAVPDGMAVMGDCEGIPVLRWRGPEWMPAKSDDVSDKLIAMRGWLDYQAKRLREGVPRWRSGHVLFQNKQRSTSVHMPMDFFLPAGIHPVIAGNLVICRRDNDVSAYDIRTGIGADGQPGQPVWTSLPLPMHRAVTTPLYYGSRVPAISDSGRFGLTSDGQRVYLLANYPPVGTSLGIMSRCRWRRQMLASAAQKRQTATLVAISIRQQGKLLWSIGNGQGDNEVIRWGHYVAVPTVKAGRLYTVVLFHGTYYAVCLEAHSGKLIWQVSVCRSPPPQTNFRSYYSYGMRQCAAVAVAEGLAFVSANSGVIAACDADSGAAVWAHRYDSGTGRAALFGGSPMPPLPGQPAPNPIIVTRGRLLCLPTDSRKLIALSTADGRRLWPGPERNLQSHLSAIGPDRVLLSGPGLTVVATDSGKAVHHAGDLGIVGRPAVGSTMILASGQGQLIRMDLADYGIRRFELAGDDYLLGNLVAADGKLVAANATGISVYVDYMTGRRDLTVQIEKHRGPKRAELLFARARLSFNAKKLDEAQADFDSALRLAKSFERKQLVERLAKWRARTRPPATTRPATQPATSR